MKKLDKLLLTSFFGPFLITFFVVVFILLTVFMLKYFDELVGKDLGVAVISQFIFYFSINVTENAFPLAVLLSSLMTFGNLGVHFELTAIKGAGISLLRTLRPLFLVTCLLVVLGFYNNNYIIPKANLEAFSLLYDIKQKKPALDIKQGVFYGGIPGYSIKINQRFPDDETIKDIIIYEHAGNRGNKSVILADSGKMYNILNSRYLVLELFDGRKVEELKTRRKRGYRKEKIADPYLRSNFSQSKLVLNLSDFDLKRTQKELFSNNRLMKNIDQLRSDLDSMTRDYEQTKIEIYYNIQNMFKYHSSEFFEVQKKMLDSISATYRKDSTQLLKKQKTTNDTIPGTGKKDSVNESVLSRAAETIISEPDSMVSERSAGDTVRQVANPKILSGNPDVVKQIRKTNANIIRRENIRNKRGKTANELKTDSLHNVQRNRDLNRPEDSVKSTIAVLDSLLNTDRVTTPAISKAVNHIRFVKGSLTTHDSRVTDKIKLIRKFEIERYKKLAKALTILAMFLIGAPLGAIIKRGGLGVPVLFSILFFVLFYIMTMLGEKWARQGVIDPFFGVWLSNMVLFPIGFFFLIQARRDAKLFDVDYYRIAWLRFRGRLKKLNPVNN